jgi:hypothetical protein
VAAFAAEVESAARTGKHCAHKSTAPNTGGMNRIIDTFSVVRGCLLISHRRFNPASGPGLSLDDYLKVQWLQMHLKKRACIFVKAGLCTGF